MVEMLVILARLGAVGSRSRMSLGGVQSDSCRFSESVASKHLDFEMAAAASLWTGGRAGSVGMSAFDFSASFEIESADLFGFAKTASASKTSSSPANTSVFSELTDIPTAAEDNLIESCFLFSPAADIIWFFFPTAAEFWEIGAAAACNVRRLDVQPIGRSAYSNGATETEEGAELWVDVFRRCSLQRK